ncbi:hypothetical protein CTEN210_18421 [Chaetoceros tenuissimus]|uniref:Helicase-associated domain-containing protein n=1 Tax=Chaetoceros tenuissimus TaxID=426638 RepID=A0AAD3DFA1_9STRA|nr:hypothetical protein CTEN210_18421 [Chaetoceros tenuissimus]
MNYTWKTVYGDQRLVDLARQLRGKSSDSAEEDEVNSKDEYSDDNNDSDDYDDNYVFVNEEEGDDNDEEEDASSSEEEEVKESKFDKRWNDKYKQLKEYKAQNGNCNVPSKYELNKALYSWVGVQRQEYRKMSQGVHSRITQERVEKLESLGFSWVGGNDAWNERYEQLREFKLQQGHCNVPQRYKANKALAIWVNTQRSQYKLMLNGLKSFMTEERIEKLKNIGFVWNTLKDTWNERFEELKQFKDQYGHCTVPQRNKALGIWVNNQRTQYKLMSNGSKSQMTEERLEKLEDIGFTWTPLQNNWDERFEELKQYKDQHGHCNVPHKYEPNKALGTWVSAQRQQYKLWSKGSNAKITEERVKQLDNIGFEWTPMKNTWNERFEKLKKYKAQNGHCNVPQGYEPNKALGQWVERQRQEYKQSQGSPSNMVRDRITMLEGIGFKWGPKKDAWNDRFEELKIFKARYGHSNVPHRYKANKSLGSWVNTQRIQYRRMIVEGSRSGCMTEERIEKLENIGFVWNTLKDTWNERYEQLKRFKAQYGHCNVPAIYEPNKSLGKWVNNQRCQYKLMLEGAKSHMTEEKLRKLEIIGFEWRLRKKRSAGKSATVKRRSKRVRSIK